VPLKTLRESQRCNDLIKYYLELFIGNKKNPPYKFQKRFFRALLGIENVNREGLEYIINGIAALKKKLVKKQGLKIDVLKRILCKLYTKFTSLKATGRKLSYNEMKPLEIANYEYQYELYILQAIELITEMFQNIIRNNIDVILHKNLHDTKELILHLRNKFKKAENKVFEDLAISRYRWARYRMEHKSFDEFDYDNLPYFESFGHPYLTSQTLEGYFENIFKEVEEFCRNDEITWTKI